MPPPGYEPFLRAICADPEDDTVRLVYADWLDENGDPERAEFIRLQIALDSVQSDDANVQRYGELLQANQHIWRDELPAVWGVEWGYFSRGFVSSLNVSNLLALADHHDALFTSAPVSHLVIKNAAAEPLAAALQLTELRHVQHVSLEVRPEVDSLWQLLANCPHLTNLQKLRIDPLVRARLPVLTRTEALPFVESPVFARLQEIVLRGPVRNAVAALLRTRFTVVIH